MLAAASQILRTTVVPALSGGRRNIDRLLVREASTARSRVGKRSCSPHIRREMGKEMVKGTTVWPERPKVTTARTPKRLKPPRPRERESRRACVAKGQTSAKNEKMLGKNDPHRVIPARCDQSFLKPVFGLLWITVIVDSSSFAVRR